MTPLDFTLLVYNIALLPVVFVSVLFLILSILYLFVGETRTSSRATAARPFITVQIPSFNDPVAARCLHACLRFSYPRNWYEIHVLDDSTDPHTQRLLKSLAAKHQSRVRYIHRSNRDGYKPGAMQAAMRFVRGEFIVVFDADFIPQRDFLERIITPMKDPAVAIVQARQSIANKDKNLVTRFASYLLMVHHDILMPINNKNNSVFFCGTAGALRVSALRAAGGWNTKSITEDSDLSVRLLVRGFKTVYVPFETPSEVPDTIESFLRQQMRWVYGGIRVFIDHKKEILFGRKLTFGQRLMITFQTVGNVVAPAVVIMTAAGFLGWAFGDPHLMTLTEVAEFFIKFAYGLGFFILGFIVLYRRRSLSEYPQFALAMFSLSLVLAIANTVAIGKAVFTPNKPLFLKQKNSWVCTPKSSNQAFR